MKKYLSIIFVISLFIAIGAKSTETTDGVGTNNLTDTVLQKSRFKNLKVLPKDITEQKLDSVMANWSVSLGARCNFCHAASADTSKRGHLDFASDAKEEKGIARYMHTMTVGINDKFFNQSHSAQPDTIHAVICYTCHHGTPGPDAKMFLSL